MYTLYDVIQQFEMLNGTYLAKRSLLNFDECINFLKTGKFENVIYELKQLRGTEWEERLQSYTNVINLKSMITILEKRERCGKSQWFSRMIKKFKFDWLPLRRGNVYNRKTIFN